MTTAVVGLGSNLGSREQLMRAALALLDDTDDVRVEAVSSVRETAPVGPAQPDFLNAAARVETRCDARTLLSRLLEVERALGRVRRQRWGPRTIDLDLLWMDAPAIAHDDLTVPHPRLTERQFALAPLLEVAPSLWDRYGDALERIGGMPPAGRLLGRRPPTRATDRGVELGVELDARDEADAIAGVVTGLVPRLVSDDAGCDEAGRGLEARPVHAALDGSARSQEQALDRFARVVLAELAAGFAPRLAVVESIGSQGVAGRLLGRSLGSAGPVLEPAEVWLRRAPGGGWTARLQVAPGVAGRPNDC